MSSAAGKPVTPLARSKEQFFFGGALAVSLLLHAVAWAALVDGVERQLPETDATPVLVDLVPPPEPEAAETEAPKPEVEKPEAQKPEALKPEAPKPESTEAPPQPETQPQDQLARKPVPVLQPVIEFGEKDSGPRIDPDGVSELEEGQEPEGQDQAEQDQAEQDPEGQDQAAGDAPEPDNAEQPEPDANEVEESQEADNAPSEGPADEAVETAKAQPDQPVTAEAEALSGPKPEPDDVAEAEGAPVEVQPVEVTAGEVPSEETPSEEVKAAEAASSEADTVGPVAILVTPKARPARKRTGRKSSARSESATSRKTTGTRGTMIRATRLFSREILNDPRVRTEMRGIPRSDRVNILCMTEMRGQLGAARPPRPPDFLPSFRLPRGNVLQPRQAAFRSRGQWFNFTFRCEVDRAATKVKTFSYRIGKAIPPADWARRGLPSY